MRNKTAFLLFLTIITTAILGGFLGNKVSAGSPSDETEKLLKTFTETLALVENNFAREVDSQQLVENAIRGMLSTLDPHSSFFAVADYNKLQEEQQGHYYGLGISIRAEAPGSGRVVVVDPPAPGTPAYKAGLQAGDVIAKVNGEPTDDWDVTDQVIPNLKGPKGTTVDVTIERPGVAEPLDFTVERDEIPLYTIKFAFEIEPGIGYIRIDKFSETTGGELAKALAQFPQQDLNGLILDLRNNPGGSLNAAIEVADQFLDPGEVIVSTRARGGILDRTFRAPQGGRGTYPMVVLVNRYSASASEIVAGALQDHDRALIVGQTSFGKALVQTIFPLEGRRGLALTTGKYYTPSDRLIQRDYSDGFFNYFNTRERTSQETAMFKTDSGRPVFGGGGIAPDEKVDLNAYPRVAQEIDRQNLFYRFAKELSGGGVQSDVDYRFKAGEYEGLQAEELKEKEAQVRVTDRTLELFKEFLTKGKDKIRALDQFDAHRELLKNRLTQELFLTRFGEEESYRVALGLDAQVQKAIAELPRAGKLIREPVAEQN